MRKIYVTSLVILVFTGMLGFSSFESKIAGGAITIFGGHIKENTTWTLSQSPYYIEGDVYVDEEYTLTIEPGVDVRFNENNGLFIDGYLNAIGLPNKMINFTKNVTSPPVLNWKSIQINLTGHAEIKYCDISYGIYGVNLLNSSKNNITHNNISSCIQAGIRLISSSNNDIIGNRIFWSPVGYGIELMYSSNNYFMGNKIYSNVHYGVFLQSSSNNKIINNEIYSNGDENIYLISSSDNNLIMNNDISDTDWGIDLSSSSNNVITGNRIYSHNWVGIFFLDSSYNNITNNNISGNTYGIYISTNSHHNRIYHNNIINNPNQALDDEADNYWNESYPIGGNYWSDFDEPSELAFDDYHGADQNILGSDGIVDNGTGVGGGKNPYVIDSNSIDNYPLIYPYQGYSTFLHEGWNLVSVPFIQLDTSLESVLHSIEGKYDIVQHYNASDKNDSWKHYHISKPSRLNDLDGVDHKMGFWIHITQPGGILFQYTGIQPTINQTITLYPGWNLVGYPSLTSYNRTQGLNNITFGVDIDSIWTYNAVTKKWEGIGESDYFEIGRGYWVHSKVEITWDVLLK